MPYYISNLIAAVFLVTIGRSQQVYSPLSLTNQLLWNSDARNMTEFWKAVKSHEHMASVIVHSSMSMSILCHLLLNFADFLNIPRPLAIFFFNSFIVTGNKAHLDSTSAKG